MNCANHPDRERTAFCQNCGKPLCSECARTVGSAVFCEPCLAARMGVPPPGYAPVNPPAGGPAWGAPAAWGTDEWMTQKLSVPGPNPTVAALLGFIPGVGAMYNGQYGKGVVHLIVFMLLVTLSHENDVFGLFVMGWIFYMVIEAHHTARARREGTPLPNPFGLNDVGERLGFGKGWPQTGATYPPPAGSSNPASAASGSANAASATSGSDTASYTNDPASGSAQGAPYPPPSPPYDQPYAYTYVPPVSSWGYPPVPPMPPVPPVPPVPAGPYKSGVPSGAILLIVLGVLFLLGNTGWFFFRARYVGPMLIIGLGVWMFVHRMTTGGGLADDGTPYYRFRLGTALRGAAWMIVIGVLLLMNNLSIFTFRHSWPVFLIIGGVMLLFRRSLEGYFGGSYPPGVPMQPMPPPQPPQTTSTAIVPVVQAGSSEATDAGNGREGR